MQTHIATIMNELSGEDYYISLLDDLELELATRDPHSGNNLPTNSQEQLREMEWKVGCALHLKPYACCYNLCPVYSVMYACVTFNISSSKFVTWVWKHQHNRRNGKLENLHVLTLTTDGTDFFSHLFMVELLLSSLSWIDWIRCWVFHLVDQLHQQLVGLLNLLEHIQLQSSDGAEVVQLLLTSWLSKPDPFSSISLHCVACSGWKFSGW